MKTDAALGLSGSATIEMGDTGVAVIGLSRSGTSLVAGCMRASGVFFGDTFPPTKENPGGNLEHVWVKNHGSRLPPTEFLVHLAKEGRADRPWGIKGGTRIWQYARKLRPDVAVFCWRPPNDIRASRRRLGWDDPGLERVEEAQMNLLRLMELDGGPVVYAVFTPRIAMGRVDLLDEPLGDLGLAPNHDAMRDFIIPGKFHE